MTATLHDLLKSYREGGVFPSYDQLAAIAGQDQIGAAVRGEAVAGLPARRFVHVSGFLDADYIDFKAGEIFGGGVLNGVEYESKHYTRTVAEEFVAEGDWREVEVSARAADAPSEPSELRWREKCAALIDIWDDAQANPPESRCYVEDAWPTMINEVRAELAAAAKSRAADALDSQPTGLPVLYATHVENIELALAQELDEAALSANDYVTVNREKLRGIAERILAAAKLELSSQPTDGGVLNG